MLRDLIADAEKIALGDEAEVKALLELLHHLGEQKVIVFTEFRDTLHLLEQMLDRAGYAGRYLTYSMATRRRRRAARFAGALPATRRRILLATGAASEGINLQQAATCCRTWKSSGTRTATSSATAAVLNLKIAMTKVPWCAKVSGYHSRGGSDVQTLIVEQYRSPLS